MKQKYEIIEKIGQGKFGNVYKGIYKKTGEPIAIKVGSSPIMLSLLKNETTILNYLYSNGCRKIPNILWYGKLTSVESLCFIMPLYECSLLEYVNSQSLSQVKIKSIMLQCIMILESVHRNFVLHRDIKPQNFMIKDGELYLIDFGFATFYVNSLKQHISIDCSNHSILGTPKYISLYNHMGISSSRRDDMISLGYILFYIFYPREPDEKIVENPENYDRMHILHPLNQRIRNEKSIEKIENICKTDRPEIYYYLKTCYEIEYHDCPDYEFLKEIFIPPVL